MSASATCGSSTANRVRVHWAVIDPPFYPPVNRPKGILNSHLRAQDPELFCGLGWWNPISVLKQYIALKVVPDGPHSDRPARGADLVALSRSPGAPVIGLPKWHRNARRTCKCASRIKAC